MACERRGQDSNLRRTCALTDLANPRFRPLSHLSNPVKCRVLTILQGLAGFLPSPIGLVWGSLPANGVDGSRGKDGDRFPAYSLGRLSCPRIAENERTASPLNWTTVPFPQMAGELAKMPFLLRGVRDSTIGVATLTRAWKVHRLATVATPRSKIDTAPEALKTQRCLAT
jgi:hypothetical protein